MWVPPLLIWCPSLLVWDNTNTVYTVYIWVGSAVMSIVHWIDYIPQVGVVLMLTLHNYGGSYLRKERCDLKLSNSQQYTVGSCEPQLSNSVLPMFLVNRALQLCPCEHDKVSYSL